NDDQMIYAKVSTGHKAGGFNDSFNGSNIPEEFDPEKVTVYELGSRNVIQLFNSAATLNATAFYYDYEDQVLQDLICLGFDLSSGDCNSFSLVNRNLGKSEIIGLELDSSMRLTDTLGLDIVATFLDSEIKDGVVADVRAQDFSQGGQTPLINLSGNQLPLQSDFEMSLRLHQALELGRGMFDWQLLVNYRDDYYLTQFNENDVVSLDGTTRTALEAGFPDRQEGFVTVNLGLGYSMDNGWRLEAFGNNLTDEQATQKAQVGSGLNLRFLNDARTYGLRAVKRF
ncbi:MAG: TonB-dependent receptor, partial [Pseudomonadota bacterium]